jgi:hypothetical protein
MRFGAAGCAMPIAKSRCLRSHPAERLPASCPSPGRSCARRQARSLRIRGRAFTLPWWTALHADRATPKLDSPPRLRVGARPLPTWTVTRYAL